MFETPTLDNRDACDTCRWRGSEMCPKLESFVGRTLCDVDRFSNRESCHRYVMTSAERERRWQQVMSKLHTNL